MKWPGKCFLNAFWLSIRQNITHIAHREVKVIYITDKKFFVMQELQVTINLRQVN